MAEYDSSITAYFGGDVTGLQAAVSQSEQLVGKLDQRFSDMGVNWGQGPKTLAAESAKAFDQIYAAQKKVSDAQEQSAYNRMSTEEKLKYTQAEALALKEQALSIEGTTVEKESLRLQYVQKLDTIYGLTQQSIKETASASAATAKESEKNVGFMGALSNVANDVKQSFKDMGIRLKGAGLGIILAEVVKLGKDAVNNAVALRDENEKLGRPIDNATRSMALLGDGIKTVGTGLVNVVGYVVGGWAQIGDLLGSAINRMRGISEAQENIAEQSQRAADLAQARIKKLEEEQHDLDKIAAAKKATADQEKQATFDMATGQQQLAILFQRKLDLAYQIQNTEKGTVAYYERVRQLSEVTVQVQQKYAELVKASADEQIQKLNTLGSLDETYAEKRATLTKEGAALQSELNSLLKDSADYKAVAAKIDTNAVAQQKLSREMTDAQILDLGTRVELQKISLGISKQDVSEQSFFVAKADLQAQLKQNQYDLGQLQIKQLREGLNPEETNRLKALYLQEDSLTHQIAKLDSVHSLEQRRNDLGEEWKKISNEQLDVMALQYAAMLKNATAEGDTTDQLKMQLDLVLKIIAARNAPKPLAPNEFDGMKVGVANANFGGFVQGESTAALQGTIDQIQKQLESLGSNGMTLLKDATINGNYGDFATASILKQQLEVAQKEKDLRSNVQSFVTSYGEPAARSQFGDTVVQRAMQDMQSSADKTAAAVTAISQQLSNSGIFPSRVG